MTRTTTSAMNACALHRRLTLRLPSSGAIANATQAWELEGKDPSSQLYSTFCADAPLAAPTVAKALYGDDSPLWALLVYMCIFANLGMRVGFLAGPIGCGKTFTVIAFAILDFILGEARTCILCQLFLEDWQSRRFSAGGLLLMASASSRAIAGTCFVLSLSRNPSH